MWLIFHTSTQQHSHATAQHVSVVHPQHNMDLENRPLSLYRSSYINTRPSTDNSISLSCPCVCVCVHKSIVLGKRRRKRLEFEAPCMFLRKITAALQVVRAHQGTCNLRPYASCLENECSHMIGQNCWITVHQLS